MHNRGRDWGGAGIPPGILVPYSWSEKRHTTEWGSLVSHHTRFRLIVCHASGKCDAFLLVHAFDLQCVHAPTPVRRVNNHFDHRGFSH